MADNTFSSHGSAAKLALDIAGARATSVAAGERATQHFLLIKQADHTASGDKLSAHEAARALLGAGIWPLWTRTPCKLRVQPGDRLAVYLAGEGNQAVVATAVVVAKRLWTPSMLRTYPLSLSGIPEYVLSVGEVSELSQPVRIAERMGSLSFIGPNKAKWGVRLMGGMRSVSAEDFYHLTAPALDAAQRSPKSSGTSQPL